MGDYLTEHITLSGGRVIRLIRVRAPERPPEAAPPTHVEGDPPGICPRCSGELVYPVSWEERVGSRWRLALRCPDCEWRGSGEFEQEDVEEFDDELNDRTEELLMTLRALTRSNMKADVERLITAIDDDAIQPMDF